MSSSRMIWERDGLNWPHREASRFVQAAGLSWHIQQFGMAADGKLMDDKLAQGKLAQGKPSVLLLHGTGASTHSWRGLAPLLAGQFEVLTVDLPGHAFTGMPPAGPMSPQMSLPGMAQALSGLLQALDVQPALVIGHSAGAAIAVRMCLDGLIAPGRVVSLNGALFPLGGPAAAMLSPVARLLASAPMVPRLFSWRASSPAVLQRLLDATGSRLDAEGVSLYGQLVRSPGHTAGALAMMANWDLPELLRALPRLATPLSLVVGERDRTISPRQADRVRAMLAPAARQPVISLPGLGHLAHEERPDLVAQLVLEPVG
jgi:magnesium chelatase accessory protein